MLNKLTSLALIFAVCVSSLAQSKLTKEQILAMSTDELSELPLEDLMEAVEILGVSSVDELFAMIMNKNVSSATKTEEDAFSSPLSSSVITRDEMRTYGVTTIEEALRLLPGMIVTEKTNGVYDIHIRGLNNIPNNNMLLYTENANTLVMIDSRPVQNLTAGNLCFEMLPIDIEDVDRIEVVRGATGALYGANAVTGVINIITTKPDNSDVCVSGNLQMGNDNTYIGNLAIRKSIGSKFAFGLTANMQQRQRPIDELYVIPQAGVYMSHSDDVPINEGLKPAEFGQYVANGSLTDFSKGGYVKASELENLRQVYPGSEGYYTVFRCLEPQTPAANMFPDPQLARHTEGYNAYLTFKPTNDIRFDITGGYQRSFVNTTPVGDDYFSFNGRQSKTAYVNMNAGIKDLSVNFGYHAGSNDYAVGVPGFKVRIRVAQGNAEYNLHAGPLSIKPGVSFMIYQVDDYVPEYYDVTKDYSWHYFDPGHKYDPNNHEHLSGYTYYDNRMTAIAPSLRLDYKVKNFRFIGAYRTDKTNIPDKWNHSWQVSASAKINDKNHLRLVYGKSNRSATIVNSGSNFTWTRTELVFPNRIKFLADEDADLMNIQNIELGYRAKPNEKLLIDFEAFFSKSKDYSALMANSAYISIPYEYAAEMVYASNTQEQLAAVVDIINNIKTNAEIKVGQLPYDVKQFGASLNVDWIISSKVIAKVNLNVQKTKIDNYYAYSQTNYIKQMLGQAQPAAQQLLATWMAQLGELTTPTEKKEFAETLIPRYLNRETNELQFDKVNAPTNEEIETEDGVENEATPSFYGMLGVVYKPIKQVSVAAFANYMSERTYVTKYNTYENGGDKLSNRFTMNLKAGYSPKENVEIFFNAHNLFNNKKREFTYCDEIGGIYTVGVNFGF